MFRAIVKRHAMTGSGLGRYARPGQPPGFRGVGPGPSGTGELSPPALPAHCTCFSETLTRKMYRKKILENAGNVPEVPGKKAKNT